MQTTSDDAKKYGEAEANFALIDADRREFLIRSAAGGGLMVGAGWLGIGSDAAAQSTTTSKNLNAWIIVASDDSVTLQVPVTEMGQGTSTGLAQIAADELCLAWNKIKVIHAPVDPVHGGVNAGPYGRFTGGSLGIRLFSPTMQQAAANARQLLLMAAASIWRVDVSICTAKLGVITCSTGASLRSLTYGQVAATAATLRLSANVTLNQTPKVFTGTAA